MVKQHLATHIHVYFTHNIVLLQHCIICVVNKILSCLVLSYKIWKQSDKDFLSYRENDEVSADTDAA